MDLVRRVATAAVVVAGAAYLGTTTYYNAPDDRQACLVHYTADFLAGNANPRFSRSLEGKYQDARQKMSHIQEYRKGTRADEPGDSPLIVATAFLEAYMAEQWPNANFRASASGQWILEGGTDPIEAAAFFPALNSTIQQPAIEVHNAVFTHDWNPQISDFHYRMVHEQGHLQNRFDYTSRQQTLIDQALNYSQDGMDAATREMLEEYRQLGADIENHLLSVEDHTFCWNGVSNARGKKIVGNFLRAAEILRNDQFSDGTPKHFPEASTLQVEALLESFKPTALDFSQFTITRRNVYEPAHRS